MPDIEIKENKSIVTPTEDGGVTISFEDDILANLDEFKDGTPLEEINLVPAIKKVTEKKFRSFIDENVLLSGEDLLKQMGQVVVEDYDTDYASLKDWRTNVEYAIKIFSAYLEGNNRSNKSRVILPLLSIAVLQFHARAFESLLPPKEIITILSGDENIERAERVSKYMNWDLIYNMDSFIEDKDTMLIKLPLVGSVYVKTFWNSLTNENVSQYISALDVVINYDTDPDSPERITQRLDFSVNEIRKRIRAGLFDEDLWSLKEGNFVSESSLKQQVNKSQGTINTLKRGRPREFLEQHRDWDLNGDGIAEPYIITVDKETRKVARIVSRETKDRDGNTITINYFTHYRFLPNPEGSMGVGFWILIGHINEASNTIINEVIEAAHLANVQGGFVTKRSGIAKGTIRVKRGEWKQVDSGTDDIRKSIFTFDFKGPSPVLFQILGLLFEFSKLVTTVTEVKSGGISTSDTTATEVLNAAEEGRKVFNAIYRRIHRSFGKEMCKIYRLNGIYLDEKKYLEVLGMKPQQGSLVKADFMKEPDIVPVSEPLLINRQEKINKANIVLQNILQNPVTVNDINKQRKAYETLYKALEIPDYQTFLPEPPPPPQDIPPQEENALFLQEKDSVVLPDQDHADHIVQHEEFLESSFAEQLTPTGTRMLEAHKRDHYSYLYLASKEIEAQNAPEGTIAPPGAGLTESVPESTLLPENNE